MKHEILAFHKSTEQLTFRIEIQTNQYDELAKLMAWTDPKDAIYEYELTSEQIIRLEAITGESFNSPDYIFQLSCSA
jgi:hypothetical protein